MHHWHRRLILGTLTTQNYDKRKIPGLSVSGNFAFANAAMTAKTAICIIVSQFVTSHSKSEVMGSTRSVPSNAHLLPVG